MDTGTAIELALWTIVVVLGGFIINRVRQIGPFRPTVMDIPPQPKKVIELKDYTPSELKEFDGSDTTKPILFSVKVCGGRCGIICKSGIPHHIVTVLAMVSYRLTSNLIHQCVYRVKFTMFQAEEAFMDREEAIMSLQETSAPGMSPFSPFCDTFLSKILTTILFLLNLYRALATMSTKPDDVGSASLEGLGAEELDTLNSWVSKFESKYTHVGHLRTAKN
jgi:hypothetical protein